jgi:rhamnose transport system substrate-binding protein
MFQRLALWLMLMSMLNGCEKQGTPSTAGTKPSTTGSSSGGIRVVYIPKNTGNPYFNGVITGLEKGCQEQGVEFFTTGPANPDATSQIPFLKDQVQRGVNVICISPNSADALNQVLDDARARGIKVIAVNSDIVGNESHRDAAVYPCDFDKLGASQIELLGSLINYEGKFAILSATTDAPDQNYWIQGMKEALKNPKYAKMELVDIVYGDDKPQKSRTEAEGLLTKYPELRAILAPTSVGVEQAAKAVEAAGVYPGGANAKGKGVVVTGLGTPNQLRRYIKDNIITAVALWSPPDEGYVSAYLAVGLATGKVTAQPGNNFTVPGFGPREFQKNNLVVTGPPLIFTKDNIDQYNF